MKSSISRCAFVALLSLATSASNAQSNMKKSETSKSKDMKTYVIEREIPGAGTLSKSDLKSISQKSCAVLKNLGPEIQWVHSYVTGNKIYCIYKAENEELVREHAKKGGFPANSVQEVSTIINPDTAN